MYHTKDYVISVKIDVDKMQLTHDLDTDIFER